MKRIQSLALFAAIAVPAGPVLAQDPPSGGAQIYQQRLPDGRVVLTDRPAEGARIQRTWEMQREDPVAARKRSEGVRQEAQAVSERIERRMQRQQTLAEESEADRLRTRLAEARRDAETARLPASTAVIYAPPAPVTSLRSEPPSIAWSETRPGAHARGLAPSRAYVAPRVGMPDRVGPPVGAPRDAVPATRRTAPEHGMPVKKRPHAPDHAS